MSRSRAWVIGAILVALAGGGVFALLASGDGNESSVETPGLPSEITTTIDPATTGPTTPEPDEGATTTMVPGTAAPPPVSTPPPATTSPATTTPPGVLEFTDDLIAEAMVRAATTPLVGVPARDSLATARLGSEMAAAGVDLTGLELTIYPASSGPAFIVMATDDSTALVNDDAGAEPFVGLLLDSPAVAEAGVERLILQHSSADDEGPFVVTFTVPMADLRAGLETGADVFERIAVQVERA